MTNSGRMEGGRFAFESNGSSGDLARLIGRIDGDGPILFCVGGLHGNEPGGVKALEHVMHQLALDQTVLSGTMVALRGNRPALREGVRAIGVDMNRAWDAKNLERLSAQDPGQDDRNDQELRDLMQLVESAGERTRFLLDLHSTSGAGPPFAVVLGGTQSQQLASKIAAPCVHGLNESINGTMASWFDANGGASIVVEGGQSGAPLTVRHMEAAIYSTLGATGLLAESHPRVVYARQLLRQQTDSLPSHVRVFHREPTRDLGFRMGEVAGRRFQSFDAVTMGDQLAENQHGPVVAQRDGYLIMPLYQNQGGEGFFLAEAYEDSIGAYGRGADAI